MNLTHNEAAVDSARLQMLFDMTALHILTQGGPGAGPDGHCQYTTAQGKHCAAAPFLTDEGKKFAKGSWRSVAHDTPEFIIPEALGYRSFVCGLQGAHDGAVFESTSERPRRRTDAEFMVEWKKNMTKRALDYGLSMAVFDQFDADRLAKG